jgi:hypothetical protein
MGPSDMPKEPPKPSEVRQAESEPQTNKFLDEWISSSPSNTVNVGQIEQMKAPPGWQEGKTVKPTGGSSFYREFHPPEATDVTLGFYYRGRRVSEQAGNAFHNLLQKPLDKNGVYTLKPSELESVREVLRDKLDPQAFKLMTAEIKEIRGKKVMTIEGLAPAAQKETRAVYIDSDGTGTAVQEILYQAPAAQYSRYLPAITSALKTIQWKG